MSPEVREARRVGRALIGMALLVPLLAGLLWVTSPPDWPRPMLYEPPWYVTVLPCLGLVIYLVGLAWMVRIHRRSHLEPDTSYWRYRS